jgi:hypothetical protein
LAVLFFLIGAALIRLVRRAGLRGHAPAVLLTVAAFLVAPAWRAALRTDVRAYADASAEAEVEAALGGVAGRFRHGLRAFVEAPALAYSSDPRLDFPTGYEGLGSSSRFFKGAAIHALLLGACMMLAGIRRTLVALSLALLAALVPVMFLPSYVPGAPVFAALVMACYLPPLALSLATAGAPAVRAVFSGAALGLMVLAVLSARDRAGALSTRLRALHLPTGATSSFDPWHEPDPARLVLAALDLPPIYGLEASAAIEHARRRIDAGAPVLAPRRLGELADRLVSTGRVRGKRTAPGAGTPRYAELFASISKELDHAGALVNDGLHANLREAAASLVQTSLIPDLAELRAASPTDPEGGALVQRFRGLAFSLAEPTARSGDLSTSIALREAGLDFAPSSEATLPETAEERARVAVLRVLDGDYERGRDDLRKMIAATDRGRTTDAIRRGILGIALAETGDEKGAFVEIKEAWRVLGPHWRDVTSTLVPDLIDYWHLAEFATVRVELSRTLDPPLTVQALKDADAIVSGPLKAASPVLPALAIGGRLRALQGRREEALTLLREARRVPDTTLRERSDGAGGRIAWPRFRKLALKALLPLLDRPEDAAEMAEVAAELERL